MPFFKGQKVVCIDATPPADFKGGESPLAEGAVYTVSRTFSHDGSVHLAEVPLPATWTSFRAVRFRPQTDIGIFVKMLGVKAGAD
jgi:hypothetical protein